LLSILCHKRSHLVFWYKCSRLLPFYKCSCLFYVINSVIYSLITNLAVNYLSMCTV